jgi:predicted ribosomally synthesized peptide with nif11-like leader
MSALAKLWDGSALLGGGILGIVVTKSPTMSTDAVISFLENLVDDEPLKARVRTVTDPETIVRIAQCAGYEFDVQDWFAGIQEVKQRRDDEISDFQKAGCPFTSLGEVVGMEYLSSSLLN